MDDVAEKYAYIISINKERITFVLDGKELR